MTQADLAIYLFLVALLPITTVLFVLAPRMSPKGTLFGVTVGEGERVPRLGVPIRRFYSRGSVAIGVFAVCLSLLPLVRSSPADRAFPFISAILTLQLVAWVVIYIVAHRRVLRAIEGTELAAQAAIADRHWKLAGTIYFNPADPAVNVPKKFGFGATLNMARPISWVIILLPLCFSAFILLVVFLVT